MASFCQALYVDCDKIGHDLLCDDVIMDRLIHAFSSKIVKNGKIDRSVLGEIVFSNHEDLNTLNSIVHPEIKSRLEYLITHATNSALVIDGALLEEINVHEWCDEYYVVDADDIAIQQHAKKDLSHIHAMQRSREAYKKNADHVFFNDFSGTGFLEFWK